MNHLAADLKFGLVRLTIREALVFDALNRKRRTFPVIKAEGSSGVKAEIKFREIAVQMHFFAMLISAAHSALEH
jgi:hypothetical protein